MTFKQLSERAKKRARDDCREHGLDHDWWDQVYADADTIAALLGINILTRPESRGRSDLAIYFSGFWSQGDGACFDGNWSRPTNDIVADIAAFAPEDERLHKIAAAFADLAKRAKGHAITVGTRHNGRYCHSRATAIELDIGRPDEYGAWNEFQRITYDAVLRNDIGDQFAIDVTEALRAFMDWIYHQLEQEYEYLTSDEYIDELLADYQFDEDGDIV